MENRIEPPIGKILSNDNVDNVDNTSDSTKYSIPKHAPSYVSNSIPNVLKNIHSKEDYNKKPSNVHMESNDDSNEKENPDEKNNENNKNDDKEKYMKTSNQKNLPLEFAYAIPIIAMLMIIGLWAIGYHLSYGAFSILLGSVILAMYAWYKVNSRTE